MELAKALRRLATPGRHRAARLRGSTFGSGGFTVAAKCAACDNKTSPGYASSSAKRSYFNDKKIRRLSEKVNKDTAAVEKALLISAHSHESVQCTCTMSV